MTTLKEVNKFILYISSHQHIQCTGKFNKVIFYLENLIFSLFHFVYKYEI